MGEVKASSPIHKSMQLQTPAGILLLIAAFTAWRTNLSPFSKGCRERDASM